METMKHRESPWPLCLELGIAFAIGTWRLVAISPREWWRDWSLLVSVFWVYSRVASGSSARSVVTMGVVAYLLGIYLYGSLPHVLSTFVLEK